MAASCRTPSRKEEDHRVCHRIPAACRPGEAVVPLTCLMAPW
jgi:hypothetical protein